MDGTGLFYFKEKHCDSCLTKMVTREDGTKVRRYYHKVLEAKLVLSEKVVVSLDSEFIENEKRRRVKAGLRNSGIKVIGTFLPTDHNG